MSGRGSNQQFLSASIRVHPQLGFSDVASLTVGLLTPASFLARNDLAFAT